MGQYDEKLSKAITGDKDAIVELGEEFAKAHISGYTRRSKTGKLVAVGEHDDKRTAKDPEPYSRPWYDAHGFDKDKYKDFEVGNIVKVNKGKKAVVGKIVHFNLARPKKERPNGLKAVPQGLSLKIMT